MRPRCTVQTQGKTTDAIYQAFAFYVCLPSESCGLAVLLAAGCVSPADHGMAGYHTTQCVDKQNILEYILYRGEIIHPLF
jgi:hypothetical protein